MFLCRGDLPWQVMPPLRSFVGKLLILDAATQRWIDDKNVVGLGDSESLAESLSRSLVSLGAWQPKFFCESAISVMKRLQEDAAWPRTAKATWRARIVRFGPWFPMVRQFLLALLVALTVAAGPVTRRARKRRRHSWQTPEQLNTIDCPTSRSKRFNTERSRGRHSRWGRRIRL